jgi:hypothetical protein
VDGTDWLIQTDYTKVAAILVSICAVIVSGVSAGIGILQWRNAVRKLKLDLYERRLNVYFVAISYYQAAMEDNIEEIDRNMPLFIKATRESRFLFKDEDGILKLMRDMSRQFAQMTAYAYEKARGGEADAQELVSLRKVKQDRLFSLENALQEFETKLEPYLDFKLT